jgi:hypothetical protein
MDGSIFRVRKTAIRMITSSPNLAFYQKRSPVRLEQQALPCFRPGAWSRCG